MNVIKKNCKMKLEEIEHKAINEHFFDVRVNDGQGQNRMIAHGKLSHIGKNTNCGYYICHFEYGNEFVPKFLFARIIEKYIEDNVGISPARDLKG